MYRERKYRSWVKGGELFSFEVIERETDLYISAREDLREQARAFVLTYRKDIEDYIKKDPIFFTSLSPIDVSGDAPTIVKAMDAASKKCGVGPMAGIAGAMAQFVGRDLLRLSDEIIIENGGDIFIRSSSVKNIGIYAGERSPFTGKLSIEIEPNKNGMGVSTSSGTVSHSLSFGNCDAAVIISDDAVLSDAMATSVGNRVKTSSDVGSAIEFAKSVKGIKGVLILIGDKMGSWGEIKLA